MAGDEETFENEGGAVAPGPAAPSAPASWSPSEEDFKALQESNRQMAEKLKGYDEYFEAPEDQRGDISDLDMSDPYTVAAIVNQIVEERLQQVTPYVRSAAQDQGKRQMKEMFDSLESEVGSFDHDLAERTAFYFFEQSNDAEKSVKEAAKYAAEIRKKERDEAVSEVRSRATRRGAGASDEPGTSGSATPGEAPARSYDEVIDKYVHQTEL